MPLSLPASLSSLLTWRPGGRRLFCLLGLLALASLVGSPAARAAGPTLSGATAPQSMLRGALMLDDRALSWSVDAAPTDPGTPLSSVRLEWWSLRDGAGSRTVGDHGVLEMQGHLRPDAPFARPNTCPPSTAVCYDTVATTPQTDGGEFFVSQDAAAFNIQAPFGGHAGAPLVWRIAATDTAGHTSYLPAGLAPPCQPEAFATSPGCAPASVSITRSAYHLQAVSPAGDGFPLQPGALQPVDFAADFIIAAPGDRFPTRATVLLRVRGAGQQAVSSVRRLTMRCLGGHCQADTLLDLPPGGRLEYQVSTDDGALSPWGSYAPEGNPAEPASSYGLDIADAPELVAPCHINSVRQRQRGGQVTVVLRGSFPRPPFGAVSPRVLLSSPAAAPTRYSAFLTAGGHRAFRRGHLGTEFGGLQTMTLHLSAATVRLLKAKGLGAEVLTLACRADQAGATSKLAHARYRRPSSTAEHGAGGWRLAGAASGPPRGAARSSPPARGARSAKRF